MTGATGAALEETLDVVDRLAPDGAPLSTSEVAEPLACTHRTAFARLRRLVDRGELETKKVGARGRVWWRPRRRPPADGGPVADARDDRALLLSSLVDAAQEYAVYRLDADGRVATWDADAAGVAGDDADEVLGEPVSTFYTDDDVAAGVPAAHLAAARASGAVHDEGWRVRRDGSRFRAAVTITAVVDDAGALDGYVTVVRDQTERHEYESRLHRYRTFIESELDGMFERIDDGFFALDEQWRFTYVNARAAEVLGGSVESLLGARMEDALPWLARGRPRRLAERAMATQASVDFVHRSERLDAWFEVRLYPSETGLSVYFDDVTERVERERELEASEQLAEAVFEGALDAMIVADDDGTCLEVNQACCELFGRPASELVGESFARFATDDYDFAAAWAGFAASDADRGRFPFELPDGTTRVAEYGATTEVLPGRHLSILRDVTGRVERERELERYEAIVETVGDGVYVVDREGRFVDVNPSYASMVGRPRESLLGAHVSTVIDDEGAIRQARRLEAELAAGDRTIATLEAELSAGDGETMTGEATVVLVDAADGYERVGVVRDVTERVERERELQALERRYRTLVDNFPNGVVLLFDRDLRYLVVGGRPLEDLAVSTEDMEGRLMADVLPAPLFGDVEPHYRAVFDGTSSEFDIEYGGAVRRIRAIPVHDERGEVFAGMAMSQDITDRLARERQLGAQHERLAALDDLNAVVRDLSAAAIDQSTRGEIERVVCEGLAATDSYAFAWIGEVDGPTRALRLRTEAGVEGYFDGRTISVDERDYVSAGPIQRAVETRELQVVEDILEDPAHERWRETARRWRFQSAALIPVVHEGVLHGVLGVYADRPHAFSGGEHEVVGHLGEVVGHAIAAVERKRALTSDEVVEVTIRVRDLFGSLGLDDPGGGRVTIERAVPNGDDDFVVFGTATQDGVAVATALAEGSPFWTDLELLDEGAAGVRYQARLVEPPVLTAAASQGGRLETVVVEDGDIHLTLQLAAGADVRSLVESFASVYPDVDVISRRQFARADGADRESHRHETALTERQLAALGAAYFGGYFEWPRLRSGEEIAETLGVSSSTFHQHLRAAQQRLLGSLLRSSAGPIGRWRSDDAMPSGSAPDP